MFLSLLDEALRLHAHNRPLAHRRPHAAAVDTPIQQPPALPQWFTHSGANGHQLYYAAVLPAVPTLLILQRPFQAGPAPFLPSPIQEPCECDCPSSPEAKTASMRATPAPIAAEDHQLATAVAEAEPPSSSANRPSLATPRLSLSPAVSPTSLSTDAPPPPRPALPTPPPPQSRQPSPSPTPGKVQWIPKKCPHGKRRTQCLACFDLGDGGGSICPHRRRKDLCSACKRARKEARAAMAAQKVTEAIAATDGPERKAGEITRKRGPADVARPYSIEALLGH